MEYYQNFTLAKLALQGKTKTNFDSILHMYIVKVNTFMEQCITLPGLLWSLLMNPCSLRSNLLSRVLLASLSSLYGELPNNVQCMYVLSQGLEAQNSWEILGE